VTRQRHVKPSNYRTLSTKEAVDDFSTASPEGGHVAGPVACGNAGRLCNRGGGVWMLRQGRQRSGGMLDLYAPVAYLSATSALQDSSPRIRWLQ
jgi:hypothetical protein